MDKRNGSGLYQYCGNRGSVGRVFGWWWYVWCGVGGEWRVDGRLWSFRIWNDG